MYLFSVVKQLLFMTVFSYLQKCQFTDLAKVGNTDRQRFLVYISNQQKITKLICLPWPSVDPRDFEPKVPRASVFALSLGSCAHAVAMGLALLPATTIGATIIKVEATSGRAFRVGRRDPRGSQLSCG